MFSWEIQMTDSKNFLKSISDEFELKSYNPIARNSRALSKSNRNPDRTYIFDLDHIYSLIELLRNEDDDSDERYAARYLVSDEGSILFAQEGMPSNTIPMHREMSPYCFAAGNIYFDEDHKTIVRINNSSGDFEPAKSSLLWPLVLLFDNFSDEIKIDLYGTEQNNKLTTISILKQDIIDILQNPFNDALDQLAKMELVQQIPSSGLHTPVNQIGASFFPKMTNVNNGIFNFDSVDSAEWQKTKNNPFNR